MKTLLRIIIEEHTESHTVTGLEKEVDFIPSIGIQVEHPIHCTIGQVVYTKDGYIAYADKVFVDTDENHLSKAEYIADGWTEYKFS